MGTRSYRTVLVGQGNVATHLHKALQAAGHQVHSVGGRTRTAPILGDADFYIIAVTDSAIAQVAEEIGDVPGLVLHTAGSVPMDVLPQRNRGVLYPLQTFSRNRHIDFRKVPLFIESSCNLPVLLDLANSLSDCVQEMDSFRRRYLHLSAVFCSNFTNRLYGITSSILAEKNIPFDVMLPLIDETAAKVHEMTPHAAQTGPAVRWNEEVMQAQIDMLEDEGLKQIYQLISKSIHDDKLRFDKD